MPALNSSCLAWVEYDYDSSSMHLGFRNGRTYRLPDVPPYHYHRLLNATLAGLVFQHLSSGTILR